MRSTPHSPTTPRKLARPSLIAVSSRIKAGPGPRPALSCKGYRWPATVTHEQRTRGAVAGIADRSVARDLCDVASLDPDYRQDPSRARPLAAPRLAPRALCHRARADDLADTRRRQDISD